MVMTNQLNQKILKKLKVDFKNKKITMKELKHAQDLENYMVNDLKSEFSTIVKIFLKLGYKLDVA